YLSTPPTLIGSIIQQLGAAGLAREDGGRFRRVIVEKPFGRDLASARALNAEIGKTLAERQIYRIDHYLGKETVQNILVFRFANHLFQLLALIAMEPPISFEADAVRDEKGKVLRAIQPFSPEEVLQRTIRGQYQGYRGEPNVAADSATETYVAMKLQVDNWRW